MTPAEIFKAHIQAIRDAPPDTLRYATDNIVLCTVEPPKSETASPPRPAVST